jgi:hypothetical protein
VHHTVCKGSVVGKEKEPLAIVIQAAYRINPGTAVYQLCNCGTVLLILESCDIASGLMKHEIDMLLCLRQGSAVYKDPVGGGYGIPQGCRQTVDGDSALRDPFLCLPSGA